MRAAGVAALFFAVEAADSFDYFMLKHVSGPCVLPHGDQEIPDKDQKLQYWNQCDISRKQSQLREEPCDSGGFKLVHWSGVCVNPKGGSDMPSRGTDLVYYPDCNGDTRVCFQKVFDPETGYFVLQHKHSGMVVHPKDGASAPSDGDNLVFYDFENGGAFQTKLLLTEEGQGGCTPSLTSGHWQYLRGLAGSQTTTIKRGTTKTRDEQKTTTWSEKVTRTVTEKMMVEGSGEKYATSVEIGHEQANMYASEWSKNKEYDLEITFDKSYSGKVLWQWQFTVHDSCGTTTPKTPDYAITNGAYEPPKCLPGYATDGLGYQKCYDATHTLPGFSESMVV